MQELSRAIVEEGIDRDTSVVPPLKEIMMVVVMFVGVLTVFVG